jgi:arylsulfatase A-like enzyme
VGKRSTSGGAPENRQRSTPPNVVLIVADDLGTGDLSCMGATRLRTPRIDQLAREGRRFANAYAPAATCTPSRYALFTGGYAFRKQGTGVLPGDAALVVDPARSSLPRLFRDHGHATGIVGKWHLGLGDGKSPIDWNRAVAPGPGQLGFDFSHIIPATVDRVPTVWIRDGRVVGLDPHDPIRVDYRRKVGDEPTGRENPDLLKQKASHGHDNTIVNGIGRIGWMTGGKAARWKDEDIADTIVNESKAFLHRNRHRPFFLYVGTHDPHVPRVPHARFAGKSGMGPRGDAILQLDWQVGSIVAELDRLGIADNTLVMFTSDNGPVIDDGYRDQAVELLGDHRPAGALRGGKYSLYEGGTRVPLITRWPAAQRATATRPGSIDDSLFSLVDLPATCAALLDPRQVSTFPADSLDQSALLEGSGPGVRDHVVIHAGRLALRWRQWKFIPAGPGAPFLKQTSTETGNQPTDQLYDLSIDPHEDHNLAQQRPDLVAKLRKRLELIRSGS